MFSIVICLTCNLQFNGNAINYPAFVTSTLSHIMWRELLCQMVYLSSHMSAHPQQNISQIKCSVQTIETGLGQPYHDLLSWYGCQMLLLCLFQALQITKTVDMGDKAASYLVALKWIEKYRQPLSWIRISGKCNKSQRLPVNWLTDVAETRSRQITSLITLVCWLADCLTPSLTHWLTDS